MSKKKSHLASKTQKAKKKSTKPAIKAKPAVKAKAAIKAKPAIKAKAKKCKAKAKKYENPMYCADCLIQSDEIDFMPTNGNPAPWICPYCGRTEVFIVDEDQASNELHDWESVRDLNRLPDLPCEAKRNTTATTVKYSFGGDRFLSLLEADSGASAKKAT